MRGMTDGGPGGTNSPETMAALVHELNNVLSAVLGYAEIVHADAGAGKVEERDAVQILAATRRAIELTDQLAARISEGGMTSPADGPAGSEPTGSA